MVFIVNQNVDNFGWFLNEMSVWLMENGEMANKISLNNLIIMQMLLFFLRATVLVICRSKVQSNSGLQCNL